MAPTIKPTHGSGGGSLTFHFWDSGTLGLWENDAEIPGSADLICEVNRVSCSVIPFSSCALEEPDGQTPHRRGKGVINWNASVVDGISSSTCKPPKESMAGRTLQTLGNPQRAFHCRIARRRRCDGASCCCFCCTPFTLWQVRFSTLHKSVEAVQMIAQ